MHDNLGPSVGEYGHNALRILDSNATPRSVLAYIIARGSGLYISITAPYQPTSLLKNERFTNRLPRDIIGVVVLLSHIVAVES